MENYKHKEAYCLMKYVCQECGDTEYLWNSRDGVTPFITVCEKCQGRKMHVDWNKDLCIPNLKPQGLRWFVDETKENLGKKLRLIYTKENEPYQCIGGNFTADELIKSMLNGFIPGAPTITEATKRPTIVCLCGSTRFYNLFNSMNLKFTLEGKIVLNIGCNSHSDEELEITKEQKEMLDELHLHKIEMADEVFIINKDGYIGNSTRKELEYALSLNKKIEYYEKTNSTS